MRRSVAILAVLIVASLLLNACADSAVQPAAPKQGGTLIIGRGGDSASLDAGTASDSESWRVGQEIIETLTNREGTSTRVIPWLATSWESTDSKTWTFHLRQGVKFHDGSPFNAEAVKFNIDRWRDQSNPYRFGRAFEYYDYEFGEEAGIEDVKVIDDNTIQITLRQPSSALLTKLSEHVYAINSPEAIQEQGDKYGTPAGKAVGTGPFKFVEWVPGDHITLERNEDWWGEKPPLDKLTFRVIPDDSARFAELKAGTIHTGDLAQTDLQAAEEDPNIEVYKLPALSTGYIAFQQCAPPFDKPEVRQAIAYAVNWGALIKPFYGELGELAGSFQPPAIPGSNPEVQPYEYNPEKAKELLAQAGLPNGFETDLWYTPVIRPYLPDSLAIGEAIAADLAQVGIKVQLQMEDWSAYLEDRSKGKFPMWMAGWSADNGDPDNYLGYQFGHPVGKPREEDCYTNDRLAQLMIDGASEPDQARREDIYQEGEMLIHQDVARIPIVWASSVIVFRKEVKGYTPVVFRSGYEKIWLDK